MAIVYKGNKKIYHVDYFTRHTAELEADPIEERMYYSIFSSIKSIPSIREILEAQQKETAAFNNKSKFFIKDNIIYYRKRLFVPLKKWQTVIKACHNAFPIGHAGQKKTASFILQTMNWPHYYLSVIKYYLPGALMDTSNT